VYRCIDAGFHLRSCCCLVLGDVVHSSLCSHFFDLLVLAVASISVATIGTSKVQWGWNNGKGIGAIFASLDGSDYLWLFRLYNLPPN
jgi:hypothetical protein